MVVAFPFEKFRYCLVIGSALDGVSGNSFADSAMEHPFVLMRLGEGLSLKSGDHDFLVVSGSAIVNYKPLFGLDDGARVLF